MIPGFPRDSEDDGRQVARVRILPEVAGSNPAPATCVLSQDIEDTSDLRVRGVLAFLGLVVAGRVEGEGSCRASGFLAGLLGQS